MDKAIVELQKYKNILLNEAAVGGYISDTKNIDEAIAELTAHKAKIDELKERCSDELDKYSEYQTDIECGLFQAYDNVLQKLEELGK